MERSNIDVKNLNGVGIRPPRPQRKGGRGWAVRTARRGTLCTPRTPRTPRTWCMPSLNSPRYIQHDAMSSAHMPLTQC